MAHSLSTPQPEPESEPANPLLQPRRSARNTNKKIDYKAMHEGSNLVWSAGSTPVSAHIASAHHDEDDHTLDIIHTESNWWKRTFRKAIEIKRHHPQLNQDTGKHHVRAIYDPLIRREKSAPAQQNPQKTIISDITEPPVIQDDDNLYDSHFSEEGAQDWLRKLVKKVS